MSLFWELHQTRRIGQAETAAAGARRKVASAKQEIAVLRARCDKLLMVCEALWTILRDKHGLTDEDLINRVNDIDLQDGQLDGRVKKNVIARCPECDRTISRRHPKCIYCGTPIVHDPFS
jgi:hypothetical protein